MKVAWLKIKSITLRSTIWFAKASITPRFSSRARTRRGLSSVCDAISAIFGIIVRLVDLDLFVLGDALEDEVLLERLGGRRAAVLADLVFDGREFLLR